MIVELNEVKWVTGIDEVGRGCLAGPVVVAAVQFERDLLERVSWRHELGDSKALSKKKRFALYPRIMETAKMVKVACVNHVLIDYMNILRATMHGFELVCPPYRPSNRVTIDGNQKPPSLKWAVTVVGGDGKVPAISAASIIAKTVRDQLMVQLALSFPDYGFDRHVGYGTREHLRVLNLKGPTPWHRKSFRPVNKATRPSQFHERLLMEVLDEGTHGWNHLIEHYERYSLRTMRAAVDRIQQLGLKVIPTLETLKPAPL